MRIDRFITRLRKLPSGRGVFNPWKDYDAANDRGNFCPAVRRRQLAGFLRSRIRKSKMLIIGEASGYQGCHFTGIPMTSERILLGGMEKIGISPRAVLPYPPPERTSLPSVKPEGFSEPTATIVWGAVINSGRDPREVCVWNTVPQHLYAPDKGMLSNRNPTPGEILRGSEILTAFLELFTAARIIAMGNAAASGLTRLGIPFTNVRHPAQGGSRAFREQISRLL